MKTLRLNFDLQAGNAEYVVVGDVDSEWVTGSYVWLDSDVENGVGFGGYIKSVEHVIDKSYINTESKHVYRIVLEDITALLDRISLPNTEIYCSRNDMLETFIKPYLSDHNILVTFSPTSASRYNSTNTVKQLWKLEGTVWSFLKEQVTNDAEFINLVHIKNSLYFRIETQNETLYNEELDLVALSDKLMKYEPTVTRLTEVPDVFTVRSQRQRHLTAYSLGGPSNIVYRGSNGLYTATTSTIDRVSKAVPIDVQSDIPTLTPTQTTEGRMLFVVNPVYYEMDTVQYRPVQGTEWVMFPTEVPLDDTTNNVLNKLQNYNVSRPIILARRKAGNAWAGYYDVIECDVEYPDWLGDRKTVQYSEWVAKSNASQYLSSLGTYIGAVYRVFPNRITAEHLRIDNTEISAEDLTKLRTLYGSGYNNYEIAAQDYDEFFLLAWWEYPEYEEYVFGQSRYSFPTQRTVYDTEIQYNTTDFTCSHAIGQLNNAGVTGYYKCDLYSPAIGAVSEMTVFNAGKTAYQALIDYAKKIDKKRFSYELKIKTPNTGIVLSPATSTVTVSAPDFPELQKFRLTSYSYNYEEMAYSYTFLSI